MALTWPAESDHTQHFSIQSFSLVFGFITVTSAFNIYTSTSLKNKKHTRNKSKQSQHLCKSPTGVMLIVFIFEFIRILLAEACVSLTSCLRNSAAQNEERVALLHGTVGSSPDTQHNP